jgi:beta-N-acetylglucosaminidase
MIGDVVYMKKSIQALTIVAGIAIVPMTVAAAQDDITGKWSEPYIRELAAKGIMVGDGKGTYWPERAVTRGEFATLIANALKLPESSSSFKDLHTTSPTLVPGINKAAGVGIISGRGNGIFAPNDYITRDEAVTIIDKTLKYKGIIGSSASLPFIDLQNALNKDAIERVYSLGIISGIGDNHFAPKGIATRGETAVMLTKMLKLVDEQPTKPIVEGDYVLYAKGTKGKSYATYAEAVTEAKKLGSDAVKHKDTYIWVKDGSAFTKNPTSKTTTIYKDETFSSSYTYVSEDVELQILDVKENSVQVQLFDTVGYVKKSEVKIVPTSEAVRSHYEVVNGDIVHRISNGQKVTGYIYGKAPSFLAKGTYYSKDNKTFNDQQYYNYFNFLSGRSKTTYTGEDFDNYLRKAQPNSVMIGLGAKFKEVEEKYNVNALMLFAIAVNESGHGTSTLAKEKNNLFGLNATDNNPFGNGLQFNSLEDGIEYAAKVYMDEGYLNAKHGFRYNGGYLGNKSSGMNVMYASDPYWGEKATSYMYRIDKALEAKDMNRYKLAVVTNDTPVTANNMSYTLKKGQVVTIAKENGTTFNIVADLQGAPEATVEKSALNMIAPN